MGRPLPPVMLPSSPNPTCTLRRGFLCLFPGLAGVCGNSCIVFTYGLVMPSHLMYHSPVCLSDTSPSSCTHLHRDQYNFFLQGLPPSFVQHLDFVHSFVSVIPSPLEVTWGVSPSLYSGFGLFWLFQNKMKSCAFLTLLFWQIRVPAP